MFTDDKPYVLGIVDHVYDYNKTQPYFVVHDLLANKIIKEEEIDDLHKNKFNQIKWEYHDFTDNKSYFIANDKTVFLLDKGNYKFNNITDALLNNHPEYQTGVGSITISQKNPDNAFSILTNDGKNIFYFPLADEAYVNDADFFMQQKGPKQPQVASKEVLAFDFSENYGQDYKLIKFSSLSSDGKNHVYPVSSKAGESQLDGSGIFADDDSAYYFYDDLNNFVKVIAHQNLTPGRLYFDPSVLYYDENTLIIKTKFNAAPGANYNYQQLDINSGKVLWTLSDELITIQEVIPFQGDFIIKQNCDHYAMISPDGKITKKITLTPNK